MLNTVLCEHLSADRVYPGFARTSSSSNDDDATSVHLLMSEKTDRRSAEEGDQDGGQKGSKRGDHYGNNDK